MEEWKNRLFFLGHIGNCTVLHALFTTGIFNNPSKSHEMRISSCNRCRTGAPGPDLDELYFRMLGASRSEISLHIMFGEILPKQRKKGTGDRWPTFVFFEGFWRIICILDCFGTSRFHTQASCCSEPTQLSECALPAMMPLRAACCGDLVHGVVRLSSEWDWPWECHGRRY